MSLVPMVELPSVPVGQGFANAVNWIIDNLGFLLDLIDGVLESMIEGLAAGLHAVPALAFAPILAALAWLLRGWAFGLFSLVALLLIQSMGLWALTMDTLALVVVSSAIAMLIALPLGVLAARSNAASQVVRPVLDFMQTMPAFVYLIPSIFFFSIGVVPGCVSTIVFAMPPGVRLTELGIRQVDAEMVEAGHAFGAPPMKILSRIQIPLAMPTIMAGVNQVIMLALSMVVIAGMVGAGGLGAEVFEGITRLDLVKGFEGGIAVVILAIYLDRLTGAFAQRSAVARARARAAA
jgi:glycine betaine/proline transport system permease protein